MNLFVRRIAARRSQEDSGYAMIMTLMLVLLISTTMLAVAGVYLTQLAPTRLAKKRVETVDAATAGLQAAVGQLRNTSKSSGAGDLTKLPCSDTSDRQGINMILGSTAATVALPGYQIQGTVESPTNPGNTETYRAVIAYFTTDPTPQDSVAVTNTTNNWWTQNAITCKAGLVNAVPSYAFIQSFGANNSATGLSATEGDRTVHAIYQFSTKNSNTAGGRLAEYNAGSPDSECLDVGTAEPTAGTQPTFEPCLAAGTPQQTWLYRSDLTIQYGGDTNLNLCIQNVTATEGQNGTPELEPCETAGSGQTYPYADATQQEQEWAYNDGGQLQEPDVNDGGLGLGCLDGQGVSTSSPVVTGAKLVMISCQGSSADYTAWTPDAAVGAGKSGGSSPNGLPSSSPTNQFVNYKEFGRCLDVNGQNFGNDLIAYPCKQAPDSSTLTWNQIWHFQAVSGSYGIFYTNCGWNCGASGTDGAEATCLVSPSSENALVTGIVCPTNGVYTTNELWKPTGDQANDYTDSYELVSQSSGYCLSPSPYQTSNGWDQIIVTNCNGADLKTSTGASIASTTGYLYLKWNAPANSLTPGIQEENEDNGTVSADGN